MEYPDRTVRIDRQHDDVGLQKPLRRPELKRQRRSRAGDRFDGRAHLSNCHRRRYRANPRRTGQRYVRRLIPGELGIVPFVDGANLIANWAWQLRQYKNAVEQTSLAVKSGSV